MMLRNFYYILDVVMHSVFVCLSPSGDTRRNVSGWNNRISVLCFKITQKRGNWVE